MSSIDDRLARDIAAVTGGVIVTDSDLLESRNELAARIDSTRGRVRLRRLVPAVAAAAVLVLAYATMYLTLGGDHASRPASGGPAVDADYLTGKAPTPELIDGIWRVDNGGTLVEFSPNRTVRFDEQGTLFSQPVTTGTYVIAGDLITVTITQDAQSACVGTQVAMRASVPSVGVLRFAPSPTSTGACSIMPPARGELHEVLPTLNKELAALVVSKDFGWQPLSDKTTLYGVWLAEGGGYLLEIDPGGSYYVADTFYGDPVELGSWSLHGSELTLTSSGNAVYCNGGDQLVLGALQQENTGTAAFRGTVERNTCRGSETPAAWILVSHAGS